MLGVALHSLLRRQITKTLPVRGLTSRFATRSALGLEVRCYKQCWMAAIREFFVAAGSSVCSLLSRHGAMSGYSSSSGNLGIKCRCTWATLFERAAILTLAHPVADFMAATACCDSFMKFSRFVSSISSHVSKCFLSDKMHRPLNLASL